jgi:7,8-dihydropterin-6-yl-methyl-4-(beta-D-ribofuranosyl)aminobenzene 5'-phosphate synthase
VTTITIIADNSVSEMRPKGLVAEWGFAAVVDDVLFDTGQTGAAVENARRLRGDATFETIVLSHGHYDHTGGLPSFLAVDDEQTVYAHPDAFEPKYKEDTHIGLPYTRGRIESDATVVEHTEPVEVAPGIHALGEIPREHPDNAMGETIRDGERVADPILDDQALAVETDEGLVLVLGCGHAGVRNTVERADAVFDAPITAIIGGTHLVGSEPDEVVEIVEWLDGRVDTLATSHCTGVDNEEIVRDTFSGTFERAGVGATLEF